MQSMNLLRITENTILSVSKIVSIGRGKSDLIEFCNKYNSADKICYFVSDNIREQKDIEIDGRIISAGGYSCLYELAEKQDFAGLAFVIMDDYYREIYDSLCELQNLNDINIYYYLNQENEIEFEYREKYRDAELQDIIIFRSGPHASQYVHGMDYGDNARALFEYMLENHINEKYELIWLVKNPEEYRCIEDGYINVHFISWDGACSENIVLRDEYYRVLCLAKYIFMTDAYGFCRNARADQKRIQLWHGCGFKTRVNFTRCEKRYELMPVIGHAYKRIHEDIYGLRDDQVVVTGYPKEDWLFHPVKESFSELFDTPNAKRYIMWLPTFREAEGQLSNLNEYKIGKETGLPIVDTYDKLEKLNQLLVSGDSVIVIKLHPFQKRSVVNCQGFSNIILIENEDLDRLDIPINRLLGKADALISDYSSAAIDYLILDRPIGFLIEDIDQYAESRGFVFDPIRDYLPGAELYNFDDMLGFVEEITRCIDSTKERRQQLKKQLHSFSDDKSCKRLVDYLGI